MELAAQTPPARQPTDAQLLVRVAGGDRAAFRTLHDRHVAAIRAYAASRVGPDHADDVTSETFVAAW